MRWLVCFACVLQVISVTAITCKCTRRIAYTIPSCQSATQKTDVELEAGKCVLQPGENLPFKITYDCSTITAFGRQNCQGKNVSGTTGTCFSIKPLINIGAYLGFDCQIDGTAPPSPPPPSPPLPVPSAAPVPSAGPMCQCSIRAWAAASCSGAAAVDNSFRFPAGGCYTEENWMQSFAVATDCSTVTIYNTSRTCSGNQAVWKSDNKCDDAIIAPYKVQVDCGTPNAPAPLEPPTAPTVHQNGSCSCVIEYWKGRKCAGPPDDSLLGDVMPQVCDRGRTSVDESFLASELCDKITIFPNQQCSGNVGDVLSQGKCFEHKNGFYRANCYLNGATAPAPPPNMGSCSYGKDVHSDGESFLSTDGCNICYCKDGAVSCTEKACRPSTVCDCRVEVFSGDKCKRPLQAFPFNNLPAAECVAQEDTQVVHVNADEFWFYYNGYLKGHSQIRNTTHSEKFPVRLNEPFVIAVHVTVKPGGKAGLLLTALGVRTFVSGLESLKCTDTKPVAGWMKSNFVEGTAWIKPTVYSSPTTDYPTTFPAQDIDARWIWSKNPAATDLWCRYESTIAPTEGTSVQTGAHCESLTMWQSSLQCGTNGKPNKETFLFDTCTKWQNTTSFSAKVSCTATNTGPTPPSPPSAPIPCIPFVSRADAMANCDKMKGCTLECPISYKLNWAIDRNQNSKYPVECDTTNGKWKWYVDPDEPCVSTIPAAPSGTAVDKCSCRFRGYNNGECSGTFDDEDDQVYGANSCILPPGQNTRVWLSPDCSQFRIYSQRSTCVLAKDLIVSVPTNATCTDVGAGKYSVQLICQPLGAPSMAFPPSAVVSTPSVVDYGRCVCDVKYYRTNKCTGTGFPIEMKFSAGKCDVDSQTNLGIRASADCQSLQVYTDSSCSSTRSASFENNVCEAQASGSAIFQCKLQYTAPTPPTSHAICHCRIRGWQGVGCKGVPAYEDSYNLPQNECYREDGWRQSVRIDSDCATLDFAVNSQCKAPIKFAAHKGSECQSVKGMNFSVMLDCGGNNQPAPPLPPQQIPVGECTCTAELYLTRNCSGTPYGTNVWELNTVPTNDHPSTCKAAGPENPDLSVSPNLQCTKLSVFPTRNCTKTPNVIETGSCTTKDGITSTKLSCTRKLTQTPLPPMALADLCKCAIRVFPEAGCMGEALYTSDLLDVPKDKCYADPAWKSVGVKLTNQCSKLQLHLDPRCGGAPLVQLQSGAKCQTIMGTTYSVIVDCSEADHTLAPMAPSVPVHEDQCACKIDIWRETKGNSECGGPPVMTTDVNAERGECSASGSESSIFAADDCSGLQSYSFPNCTGMSQKLNSGKCVAIQGLGHMMATCKMPNIKGGSIVCGCTITVFKSSGSRCNGGVRFTRPVAIPQDVCFAPMGYQFGTFLTDKCQTIKGYDNRYCDADTTHPVASVLTSGQCTTFSNGPRGVAYDAMITCKEMPEQTTPSCDSDCLNGGICWSASAKGISCDCKDGWRGPKCDLPNTPICPTCENGGQAYLHWQQGGAVANVSTCYCKCKGSASGSKCEVKDQCSTMKCLNGGTCYVDKKLNVAACKCAAGFIGNNCGQSSIAVCQPNPCENGGTCSVKFGSYVCNCTHPYVGLHCEIKGQPPHPAKCDQSKVTACVTKATTGSGSTDTCSLYTGFTNCAIKYGCSQFLSLWCNIVKQKYPTCSIDNCKTKPSSCNIDLFENCYVKLTSSNITDHCSYVNQYIACGQLAKCDQLVKQGCGSIANCVVPACPTKSSSLLEDYSPQTYEEHEALLQDPFTTVHSASTQEQIDTAYLLAKLGQVQPTTQEEDEADNTHQHTSLLHPYVTKLKTLMNTFLTPPLIALSSLLVVLGIGLLLFLNKANKSTSPTRHYEHQRMIV